MTIKTPKIHIFVKYLVWIVLILLVVFRYFSTRPVYKNGDTLRITSTVFSDPVSYGNYQSFFTAGLKIYLPIFPEINYGDTLVLEGIYNSGKLNEVKLISQKKFSGLGSKFRKRIIDFYERTLPQPMAGLVAGIALGSKGTLIEDFWNSVKKTGVAHVVVASGTNVTFVVSFVFLATSLFMGKRKSILFVILSIVLYLFLSGFEAPLVRAAIMAFLTFWAVGEGRIANAWRILFLTAGLMLIINPDWIVDLGFILSFVSTASIMLFEKRIGKYLKFIPGVLKEGFSTSFAAQIGVAPILFVTFGKFNILSPLVNALVLWTIPYIMILGVVGGVIGLFIPIAGKLLLYICYPLTWWFVNVVKVF